MGRKWSNKEKQVMINNNHNIVTMNTSSRPWPDLPDQLIKLISKRLSLLESVGFDGVAKTWRTPPKQCNNSNQQFPWLELISYRKRQDVYSIPELPWTNAWWYKRERYRRMSPEDPIIGSSQGQLLMKTQIKNDEPHLYSFWSPPGSSMGLPQCDDSTVSFQRVVLSKPLDDFNNNSMVLVLIGGSKPGFMFFYTKGDFTWTREECTLLDPNSSKNNPCIIQFTNAVFFMGKFYALSIQGTLAVIDTGSDSPRVTILGVKRAIPSTCSRCFKEYLVESCGEILLVFLISRKTTNIIDDIEVLRLDLDNRSWVKMESLGDRTLFVGVNCFMPVSASKLGCRANCVYFKQDMIDGWWVFDMESKQITQGWNDDSIDKSPTWVTPVSESKC